MASSVVEIYNLACSAGPGTRTSITAVDEGSREAEVCTLWYDTTLEAVLRAAPWTSTTAYERLALLYERDFAVDWTSAMPPPEWGFEYASPANMIRPRYLTSFERFDLSIRDTTHTIVTNVDSALLCYTKKQTLVSMWDASLTMAMTYALGANITMGLTGKLSRARSALEAANDMISQARVAAANEREVGLYETLPSWLAIRGAPQGQAPQYIYPPGPLLSLSNVG